MKKVKACDIIEWESKKGGAMDVTVLTQIVSTVGFPIAMCGLLAYYIKYTEDKHREEIDKLTQAVNNNTLLIQKLLTKMDEV